MITQGLFFLWEHQNSLNIDPQDNKYHYIKKSQGDAWKPFPAAGLYTFALEGTCLGELFAIHARTPICVWQYIFSGCLQNIVYIPEYK